MPPAFRFITLTRPTKCTPFLSKLYQPAPLVFLPKRSRYCWPSSSSTSCSPGTKNTSFGARGLQNLLHLVELSRFRQMRDVAGVQHELGRNGQRVDLRDRGLQRSNHVGIRGLVEAHVAVADLHEAEFALSVLVCERR